MTLQEGIGKPQNLPKKTCGRAQDLQKKTLTFGCTPSEFKHLPWKGQGGGQRHVAIGNRLANLFPIQHDASRGHWEIIHNLQKMHVADHMAFKQSLRLWTAHPWISSILIRGGKGGGKRKIMLAWHQTCKKCMWQSSWPSKKASDFGLRTLELQAF